MIQTQLLKADRPYQIISAGGHVGIQVATLIVTEDKMTEKGYEIDTHSHPVVNYAIKDDLMEELKYWNGDPKEEWKYTQRLQPEGAVWNKVEVRDVRVLGLVGANNPSVDLEKFVSLVPSIPSEDPVIAYHASPLWEPKTDRKIRNLIWELQRLGIKCETVTQGVSSQYTHDGHVNIELKIDPSAVVQKLVRVQIRMPDFDSSPMPIGEISFRCPMYEESKIFIETIVKCMTELDQQFIREGEKIRFVYRQTSETKNEWEELLEKATKEINEAWKSRYHYDF